MTTTPITDFFPDHQGAFAEALQKLEGRKVAVIGHMRPDGDCIGSIVGMTRVLNAAGLGIDAIGLNRDTTPRNLEGFIGDTPFLVGDPSALEGRLVISVDCADDRRMSGSMRDCFDRVFLNVDHHISNPGYAELNIVEGAASATAEILAGLFLEKDLPIDPVAAQALYIGMATDTGQFRFASTSPQVFEICCQLCAKGADPAAAAFALYENESFAKLLLLQRFLASLTREFNGRVCIGRLSKKDFEETGAHSDDTEGLVDYARSIEGVDIGVLIEERGDGVKGSLRAKDPIYQVQEVAQRFNGGGHACAAGLNVSMSMDGFRESLIEALGAHLEGIIKA